MVRIQKNIIVAKPAQAIWSLLDNPAWSSSLNPNLKLVCCFESCLGGYDHIFRYRMGGHNFESKSHMTAYEPGHHMAYDTQGGLDSRWYWWLESDGRQTHVSLTFEYAAPSALSAVPACDLEQENNAVLDTHLKNLKRRAEEMG